MKALLRWFLVMGWVAGGALGARTVEVRDGVGLDAALRRLEDGVTLRIAGGVYGGGRRVAGVARLTVEAMDAADPPVFRGGSVAWQFSRCEGLTVRGLVAEGQADNGFNLDDGGQLERPVGGVTLERLVVRDVGPSGNHDGIKCSGLRGLVIRDCELSGWGGQGIDFVGCHDVRVSGCRLLGKEGFSATAGIQIKGGSSGVVVEGCRFEQAGLRALNIGGSTGLAFFRPPGAKSEASRVTVRGNHIEGSECAAAFVGVDGVEFSGNTVRFPRKWIFRILQETREPGFVPCRNGVIKGNRIVFRRGEVRTDINLGEGTAPESFRFEGNRWHAEDRPEASKPVLPVAETGGVYGGR